LRSARMLKHLLISFQCVGPTFRDIASKCRGTIVPVSPFPRGGSMYKPPSRCGCIFARLQDLCNIINGCS
jgi:hypothetical protein